MRQEYNEKVFPVHTPSILHGALVGAGSLYLEVGTLRNYRFSGKTCYQLFIYDLV